MSAEYIRSYYNVPAKRGMRVTADDKPGTIVAFRGNYLGIRLAGDRHITYWHPTWRIDYAANPPMQFPLAAAADATAGADGEEST